MEETKILRKKDIVVFIAELERDLAALTGRDVTTPARRKELAGVLRKYLSDSDFKRFKDEIYLVDDDIKHGKSEFIIPGDVRVIAAVINKAKNAILRLIEENQRFLETLP